MINKLYLQKKDMFLSLSIKEIASTFMVLFAIIDITGSIPVILDVKSKGNEIKPLSAVLGSFFVFVVFLFAGERLLSLFGVDILLSLFGVDIESFAVAGAIIILVLAIEMILGVEIMQYKDAPKGSATIVPLIFPLIAGAGALTTILSLRAEFQIVNILVGLALNMIVVYLVLRNLDRVERIFGKSTIYVLRKFFGIILLAIALKLFLSNVVLMFK